MTSNTVIDSIILICGCGHSGTSLLGNMIASHSQVYIPLRETETFLDTETAHTKLLELQQEFLASGKLKLVEKTPNHINRIEFIESLVSRPNFIFMVRDGRDVAASYIKRTGNASDGYKRWIHDNRVISNHLEKKNTIIIKYEDLISNPNDQLEIICNFVGVEFEIGMLEYHKTPRLWFNTQEIIPASGKEGKEHINLRNWQINQPIFDDRGKWKTLLSDREKQLFDSNEAKELLKLFGYI